ncbi:MAG: N-6 DNA methylase [Nanoarchaeota archaeon]|nr:N-6 DNA methylase [Nanoarchaeota archaeon]
MISEISFTEKVLNAFKNIIKEIEKGSLEHDIRPRLVKYFIETVLGYSGFDYRYEKERADLTIFDENKFVIIQIETKRPNEPIKKEQYVKQAFGYAKETTKYVGLTNFLQFKLWELIGKERKLRIDLDFDAIFKYKRLDVKSLSPREKSQILFFNNLTKDILFDPKKYEEFDENYAKIDITKKDGFNKLLERLNYIVNELLFGHTLKSFGEYKEGYSQYTSEISKIDEEIKNNSSKELKIKLMKLKEDLKSKYERYLSFSGFELWKQYSGREDQSDDEVREIFCKETIYVLLNKLLFIRICEDKGLLPKNISNGGIKLLRERIFDKEKVYKEILNFAYRAAHGLYSHFYEPGILDWYITGNSELDDKLNKVLWILNQFNFSNVDRDILGVLYERYLPREERKKLGEFYTPVDVIRYILNSVGYTYNKEIRDKDLLDPACGSGGFLVEATRRLISKYLIVFNKANKEELKSAKNWKKILNRLSTEEAKIILESIAKNIHGLDINPFACHITEMNLLFQIIDLYQKIRREDKKYKLKRFEIYRTNSLDPAKVQKNMWEFQNSYSRSLAKDQEEIDAIKNKKFDFVVGNPPYVRKEKISILEKKYLEKNYKEIYHGDNDLCVYFLYRGVKWLNNNGKFGYIISSKFTKTRYGKYIRAFTSENTHIAEFIDLRGSKVFANVTVDPAILILDKKKSNNIRVVNVKGDFKELVWDANLKKLIYHIYLHKRNDYQDEYINSFTADQDIILKQVKSENGKRISEEWKLISDDELKIFEKIKKVKDYELSKIGECNAGIKTGKDDVFIVNDEVINKYKLERKLLKPILDGKDIKKYKIMYKGLYLIFPEGVNISDYPNTKDYLEKYKQELEKRTDIIKTNKKWYELRPCAYYNLLNKEKIVTPDISMQNNFSYDDGTYLIKNTAYFISTKNKEINLKFILGLLNSKCLEFYFKRISVGLGRSGYRYTKQHLDKLAIKLPKTSEEKRLAEKIVKKVDEILTINRTLQELKSLDVNNLIKNKKTKKISDFVSFSIRDNAKFSGLRVQDNKIYLNLVDYIKVKDKTILKYIKTYLNLIKEQLKKSKDIKEIIYNIEVPINKQDIKIVLSKLSSSSKEEEFLNKVKRLEKEIDELVYDLYDVKKYKEIIEGKGQKEFKTRFKELFKKQNIDKKN